MQPPDGDLGKSPAGESLQQFGGPAHAGEHRSVAF
jgi:hypothetical protein